MKCIVTALRRETLLSTEFVWEDPGARTQRRERTCVCLRERVTSMGKEGLRRIKLTGQAEKAGFCSVGRKESRKVLSQAVIRWGPSKELAPTVGNRIWSKDGAQRPGIAVWAWGRSWGTGCGGWDTGGKGKGGPKMVKRFWASETENSEAITGNRKYRRRSRFRVCRRWIILGVQTIHVERSNMHLQMWFWGQKCLEAICKEILIKAFRKAVDIGIVTVAKRFVQGEKTKWPES